MLRDLRSIILMALCCVTFGFCTQVFAGRGDILLTLESPMQGDPVWGLTCDGTHLWGYGDSRRLLYKMTFNGDVISTRTVTRSMYGMDWHEGALWYSSPAGENSEIRRLNLSGEETTAFLFRDENGDPPRTSWGYYANPYGVAWENDNVWVSPGHNEHLYRYDIATTTTRAVGSMTLPFHMPWGVAWGNGSLWVINTGTPFKIYEFSTAGEVRSIMPYPFEWPAATPVDLAWDGISLWCSDPARHEIIRLTTDGRVLSSFRTPLRQVSPKGLAFDGATLWITHRENYPDSELMRVTTSGSVVDSFPIDTNNYADDMAWDGTRLLMADSNFRLIRVYDTQGKQTQSLAPSRWTTQDKVFRPYGVAFDGARVLVSLLEVFSYTWSVETMTASGDMVSSFPLPASPWPLARRTGYWPLDSR